MQRGRFFILVGVLLIVMVLGLLLVMNRQDGEDAAETKEPGDVTLIPTPVPPTPIPTERVVVAQQRIPRGTLLITGTVGLSEWVSVEDWPVGWLTREALSSLDEVEGRIARAEIPRGTVLTANMLTDEAGDLADVGSDAALLIPRERVAIAIPVDHISSVGWSLRRGDRVDVLVSFLMVDFDEEFQTALPNQAFSQVSVGEECPGCERVLLQGTYGRIEQDPFGQPINVIPSEPGQRPRLVSQITVRDAEVLNLGPWGELFGASGQTSITYAPVVTPEGEEGAEAQPEGEGEEAYVPQQVEILLEEGQRLTEDEILREYLNESQMQPLLLIVDPQDALVLKWADEAGAALHIVLRSYEDAGVRLPDTEAVTLQYMVDRFNIALPPGLAYGFEPALEVLERSFLQLEGLLWKPYSAQPPEGEEGTQQ